MPLSYYILIILAGILALLWISIQWRDTSQSDGEKIIQHLENKIEQREKQLKQIETEIKNASVNKSVNIQKSLSLALDIYEGNGIKIPADIIEEGSRIRFRSPENAIEYIEQQRQNWKMENSKKLYKGVK